MLKPVLLFLYSFYAVRVCNTDELIGFNILYLNLIALVTA